MISTLRPFWLRLLAHLTLLLAFTAFAAGASAQSATITFFHNDALGSPAIATDANGDVLWKENYMPYGQPQQVAAAVPNNKLWFTGKPYDPGTGLSYFGARYYIPVIGRFTGMDPKGLAPEDPHSFNRYAYANNNPYKYVDPDGHSAVLAFRVGLAVLALAGATNSMTPEQKRQAGALLQQRTSELLDRVSGLVFNEGGVGADGEKSEADPRAGKKFTPKGKREVKEANAAENGGEMKCEGCGETVVNPQQHQKGVTPPGNEAHVDHIEPRSKGGAGSPSNGQVLCRTCNLGKSDN